MINKVSVIGGGLAGAEAANVLSRMGVEVDLYEMKPNKKSPAHSMDTLGELVCSNSLRAAGLANAAGLLKQELRELGSLIMRAADATAVPAGGALAVERNAFSRYITEAIKNDPNITLIEREVTDMNEIEGIRIIAAGPLASDALSESIKDNLGGGLNFYDAAAPIITAESVDMEKAYFASRYGKGDPEDYLNCPLTKEEYDAFWLELTKAECAEVHGFEKGNVFEGCMPVEEMASRGPQTLTFGPMKPVGLPDPRTGREPYAVVQLRREDVEGTLYNLVGFQTHLKFGEQKRVFGMVGALKNAEFVRYGVMHRNTYINSPGLLDAHYRLKKDGNVFFAGQITGVEGYIESAASGFYAAMAAAAAAKGEQAPVLSARTAIGALANYVSTYVGSDFQPMNINFGIMEAADKRFRKKAEKNAYLAERALNEIREFGKEQAWTVQR